jgi:hypothetical protein
MTFCYEVCIVILKLASVALYSPTKIMTFCYEVCIVILKLASVALFGLENFVIVVFLLYLLL